MVKQRQGGVIPQTRCGGNSLRALIEEPAIVDRRTIVVGSEGARASREPNVLNDAVKAKEMEGRRRVPLLLAFESVIDFFPATALT